MQTITGILLIITSLNSIKILWESDQNKLNFTIFALSVIGAGIGIALFLLGIGPLLTLIK